MKIFVVRLNPDPRKGKSYSSYPTIAEYNKIYKNSPMDGFHEAVNFFSESGATKGYLPPRFSAKIRSPEPFILISITAKTAKSNGDQIVGLQAGCRYLGEQKRSGGKSIIKKLGLTYHYSCPSSLSLLFNMPLPNARDLVIEKNRKWWRGPTYEIARKLTVRNILNKAINENCIQNNDIKLNKIINILKGISSEIISEFDGDSTYNEEVDGILETGVLEKVEGNKNPRQKEVISYQYERDPKVAAYALLKAKGICNNCNEPGPFISKRNNMPFLEVHHSKQLKDGGGDVIENVVALCPNCHRKCHFA